jgi:hypothetical protein
VSKSERNAAYYAANREKIIADQKARDAANPEARRARDKKRAPKKMLADNARRYGLTVEQYHQMLENQRGLCAICLEPPTSGRGKKLYIDHDHKTGKVRGLLCHHCNMILGYAKDSSVRLTECINYLDDTCNS